MHLNYILTLIALLNANPYTDSIATLKEKLKCCDSTVTKYLNYYSDCDLNTRFAERVKKIQASYYDCSSEKIEKTIEHFKGQGYQPKVPRVILTDSSSEESDMVEQVPSKILLKTPECIKSKPSLKMQPVKILPIARQLKDLESEASEPEEVTESKVIKSVVIKPEVIKSVIIKSEAAKPEVIKSEIIKSVVIKSEAVKPEADEHAIIAPPTSPAEQALPQQAELLNSLTKNDIQQLVMLLLQLTKK
ncbi:Hypothetical_protein [Hexamita inflata]|uniref:Hypothetical_protein n=1 Tax=Hexamita inflata TaxID=28002 RepID=A0AA86QLI0_9EUKA|nr:Hypothetical protein HINF_LOCUS49414 [Hexamita inflata]